MVYLQKWGTLSATTICGQYTLQFLTHIFDIPIKFGDKKDPQGIITIIILQNKELWILTFNVPTEHSTPLYKNKEIIKNNIHNKGYQHLFCISTNE